MDGQIATDVRVGEQLIAVRVRAPADLRQRIDQIGNFALRAPDGHRVNVRQVATISIATGQKQLEREQLAPFIGVTARLEGRDLGSAMAEVRKTVTGLGLPAGIRVEYGGLYPQQQQSFHDLAMVFSAALLLALLLITVLFRHIFWSLAAIATILLAASSVLLGLWITGIELNISALMGLTMVIGMVSELIIFYLAEIPTDRAIDVSDLKDAGANRLRPILMSALIAILTLLPLAVGFSRGSRTAAAVGDGDHLRPVRRCATGIAVSAGDAGAAPRENLSAGGIGTCLRLSDGMNARDEPFCDDQSDQIGMSSASFAQEFDHEISFRQALFSARTRHNVVIRIQRAGAGPERVSAARLRYRPDAADGTPVRHRQWRHAVGGSTSHARAIQDLREGRVRRDSARGSCGRSDA